MFRFRTILADATKAILLLVILVSLVFINRASAATASYASDTLSTHKVSTSADHQIRFKAVTGVDSPTDTITLNLSPFAFGAVGVGDIDILHGPVTGQETSDLHAAAPGINTWGIGVAGGIITLIAPTNAAPGTIPAGNFVTILIGTNATGGVNRLTNPAVAGSYQINIGGTFGDSNALAVAIMNDDSVTITANIIGALTLQSITPSSVIVASPTFTLAASGTGFTSNSVVRYNGSDRVTTYIDDHHLTATIPSSDLTSVGTEFITVWRPITSELSNTLILNINPLPAGGGGVTPVLTIDSNAYSNIQAINITNYSARIIWDTSLAASSRVDYGLTNAYGDSVSNSTAVMSHGIDLTGLQPNTVYHFMVTSQDQYGQIVSSADYTFTTLGSEPLIVSNTTSTSVADTSAIIVWDTNRPANSHVDYGTTPALGMGADGTGEPVNHALTLTGLTPVTLYYYRVTSQDALGATATSSILTFRTVLDATPPTNVNLTATPGDTVVLLQWSLPTEPDFAGVRLVRCEGGYPAGPNDCLLVYQGLANSALDTSLINGTTYYYAAYAYDTSGNFASGALATATPLAGIKLPVKPPIVTTPFPPPPIPPPGCNLNCAALTFDLYIVNPDGTERHMGTNYVRAKYLGDGLTQVNFEDSGADFDYNDLVMTVDKKSCSQIVTHVLSVHARWVHQIHIAITSSAGSQDILLWPDSSQAVGQWSAVNAYEYKQLCEALPLPPPTKPPIVLPTSTTPLLFNVQYYAAGGTVMLQPDERGYFGVLANNPVTVFVPTSNLGSTPKFAVLTVNGQVFNLSLNQEGTGFTGSFTAPASGTFSSQVRINLENGQSLLSDSRFEVQTGGLTVEAQMLRNVSKPKILPNTKVTLYENQNGQWVPWNGAPYGQTNPILSDAAGRYAFVVLNGQYYVLAEKEGYDPAQTPVLKITNNTIGGQIPLIRQPGKKKSTVEALGGVPELLVYVSLRARALIGAPQIIGFLNSFLLPVLFIVGLMNTASAIPLLNLLSYLQFLFTQPILLFNRKKQKRWGVIYNSLTKQPIEYAVVRLLHFESRLIVQTRVTDKLGRYVFYAKPSNYLIDVSKPGFTFPTKFLSNSKEDGEHMGLYHGEMIALADESPISFNVPLDPITTEDSVRTILFHNVLRIIQHVIALTSAILSFLVMIVVQTGPSLFVFLAQMLFYYLFRRLSLPAKSKPWGKVYDASNDRALRNVVVRIFDKKYNKLLETIVTDGKGRFGFFADKNLFYVTAEKPGYTKFTSEDLDLVNTKRETVIDFNIGLKPIKKKK
jgi:hypothetical protein